MTMDDDICAFMTAHPWSTVRDVMIGIGSAEEGKVRRHLDSLVRFGDAEMAEKYCERTHRKIRHYNLR